MLKGDGKVDEISQTPSPFSNLMPPAGDAFDQRRDAAKAREHRPLRGLNALGKRDLLLAGERSGVAHLTEVSIDQATRERRGILRRHRTHPGKLAAVPGRPAIRRAVTYEGRNRGLVVKRRLERAGLRLGLLVENRRLARHAFKRATI